jgi:hypothetical protein
LKIRPLRSGPGVGQSSRAFPNASPPCLVKDRLVKDRPVKHRLVKDRLVKDRPVKHRLVKDRLVKDRLATTKHKCCDS